MLRTPRYAGEDAAAARGRQVAESEYTHPDEKIYEVAVRAAVEAWRRGLGPQGQRRAARRALEDEEYRQRMG